MRVGMLEATAESGRFEGWGKQVVCFVAALASHCEQPAELCTSSMPNPYTSQPLLSCALSSMPDLYTTTPAELCTVLDAKPLHHDPC